MVQQDTRVSINIGPWVLDLAEFLENWWDNLIYSLAKLDEVVTLDVSDGEFSLMDVSGVSVSQDGMTVTWDNFTRGEGLLGEFSNLSFRNIVTEFFLRKILAFKIFNK